MSGEAVSRERYRKKPVVVEAMQSDGTDACTDEIADWIMSHAPDADLGAMRHDIGADTWTMLIHTLEGDMEVRPGWWVIRGVRGEFYPCRPDIFEATYELEDSP